MLGSISVGNIKSDSPEHVHKYVYRAAAGRYSKLPKAGISIEIPDETWIRDISEDYPDVVFHVLSAFPGEKEGFGIVEIESADEDALGRIVHDISRHEVISDLDILWKGKDGNRAIVQFRTTRPMMLLAARRSNVPVRMPFEIQDGTGQWELTASRDRISSLTEVFDMMDIEYELRYVREIDSDERLTERQRNVVETAIEVGYYDTPRGCSLSEVAGELGIAKSTCSGILHRAEEKIIKDFFDMD